MEAMNGLLGDGEKGVAQPPSPLTGCYLLIVVGEPCKEQHKDIILQRITKGLLSWDVKDCMVDLEKELAIITEQALDGEEARYGERLIQFASENLVTEILIHPAVSTLVQCMRNLLGSFTRHRHIIHAGYTFAANGSWALQDGTFSYSDFSESFQEIDVQRILHAYENGISLDLHCSPEGDWPRLPKEPFAKACRARINPADVLGSGSTHLRAFLDYLAGFLRPATLEKMLASSEVVGNIRFSRPTLYVFPGGQGDAALFGINGFNMLLDGGFSRKACFWDFVRHLDRLDAVLLTRLNNSNVGGISSILRRKKQDVVYPQIGHFFCNIQERRTLPSPDGDKDKDPLLINLLDEGQEIISNLRYLNLHPQPCYRDNDPINLYHKVGHGTLDMYVLSPSKDSKEVKDFLHKWNHSDQKLFAGSKSRDFNFPVQNLVSVAALLVWQPANPTDTITRILFPGSSPQSKIFEGLDKLKSLECVKRPTCSVKSLQPLSAQKKAVIERITPKEKLLVKENKTIENNIINGDVKEKTVKKSDSTESDRSTRVKKVEESKLVENGDKPKPKPKPKVRGESQQRKKPPEKKASPTTPKKTEAAEARKPAKPSPLGTPAKSTKDANNRKVVESKVKREAIKTAPAKPRVESRPLAKKPAAKKAPTSPSKKLTNGVQKPDSISRKGKLDKEGTTDSSTVSTPSVDQESILKKELSQEDIQKLQAQELADLKEEQEAVKEIEAVFRKGESQPGKAEELRAVKDVSLDDKEEYIVIEKEVIEQESLGGETKEDEIQKLARDSEESEKPRRSSAEAADKEVLSPEDRPDVSSDKKTTDKEIEEVKDVVESHPDEKISANIKSGDTTTAPTLPEDERIPLDEIKEDGYAVEEKHVKEETKEKGLPVIQLPQKTFESVPKIPGAVGIRLDKQQLIRDIVKTPDEVADLPVHEEVDYEYTHELRTEPVKTNEVQEAKAEQQAQMVFPKEKQKEVELEEKDKDEVNNDAKEEQEELPRLTDAVHENEDSEKGTIGVGLRSDIKQKSSETKIEAVAEHGKIPTENIKDEGDEKDLQKEIVLPERRSPEEEKKDSGDHTVEFEQKSHERREEELVGKVETESQFGENLVLEDPKSKPVEKEMPKAVETKTKTPEEEKEQVVVIEDREKEVQKEKTETEFTKNISVHETIGSYSEPEKQKEKVAEESGKTESKLDEHVSDESKKITEAFSSDIKEVRHESVEKQLGINEAEEVISHAATSKTESEFKEEEESGELLHKDSVSDIKEETETASRKIVEAVTKTQTKQEEELVVNEDATKKKENEKIEPALDKGPIMLVQEKMSSDIPEKLKEQTQQEMPENEEKGITTITSEVPSDLDHGKVEIEEMETEPNTTECEKDTDNIVLVNKSMDNIQEPAPKEEVEAEKKVHSGDESEELEMVDQEALKKVTGTETIENKAKGDLKAEVPTALNEVKTKEQQEQEDEALADQEIAAAELKPQAAPEAIEKIELGRKSPKEREEDVIKIVASVAEVLKSDAPLEEFTGKLPINTFGSYTTELRETHITTMDSPLIETKVIKTDIPTIPEEPHTASASFIDEEIKAYTMQESEDKRISLLKESQEFMKATSKMLSDIKATTEKSIPTEEPDAEEKIDDDDVSTVHRMLVTASSEDGGEEIEICPAGSIIFSKSSESSGRSSPDPSQKTQKSSMVDTSESLSTVRQILDDQTQRGSEIHGLASQEIENEAPKDKITEHEVKSGPQNIEETVVAGATKIGEAEIIEKVLQDEMSQKTIQSSEEKLQKEYATGYQLEDSLANENDAAEKDSEKVEVQQTRKESTSQLGKEELATIECQIEQKASMQENQEVLPNTPADVGQGKLSSTFKVEMPLLEDMKPTHPEPASADQEQLQPAETQPKIQETEITMPTQSQAARPDVEVSKDSEETVEVSAAKDDHEDDKKDEVVTLQTSQKEEASPKSTSLDHKLTKDIENEFYDDTEVVISKTGEQLKDIKKIGDKELLEDSVETTGSLEEHCGKINTDSDVEAKLKASKQITEEKGETEQQLTRAETESEHKISEATDHETDSFMKGLTATTSKVIANIFQEVENETKDKLDEMESSIEILQNSVTDSATKIDKEIDDVVVDLKKEADDIKSMADHHIDAVTKSVVDLPKDLANINGKLGQKEEEFDCSSQVVSAGMKDTTDNKTEVEVETTKEALKENVTQQLEDKSLFQDISDAANESINTLGEAAESIAGKITGLFEKTEDLCKEKHEQVVGAVASGIETIQSKMTTVGDDLKVHQEITDEVKDATTAEYSIQSATDVHQVISGKETGKTEQTTGDKDQEKEARNISRIVPDSKSDSTETELTKIKSDVKNEVLSEKTQKIGTPLNQSHIEDVAVRKPDESSTASSKKSVKNGFGSELSEEASHEKSDFEAQTVSSKLIPEPQISFNKESAEGKKIDTNIETKSETLNLSNADEKLQSDQEKMDEKTLKQEEILVDSAQDLEETFETVSDMSKSVVFEKMSSEKKTVESGSSGEELDETDTKEGSKHKVADCVKDSVDEYKEDKISETLMPTKEKGEGKDTADQKVVEVESQILTAASKDVKEDSNDSISDQKQQEVQDKITNQLEESVRDINEQFENVAQSLSSLTFENCEKINDEQITNEETISQSVDTPKCSDDDSFDIPKEVLKDKEEKLKDSAEDVKETYDELNQLSQSIQFDKCDKVDQKNWTDNSKYSVIEPPKSSGEDTRKEEVEAPNEMEQQLGKSAEDLGDTYDNVAQLSKSVSFEKCEKTSEHKENPKPNDAPAQLEVSVSTGKCDKTGTKGSEVEEMAKALGHTPAEMIKSHESEKGEKETMEKSAHFAEGNKKTELQVAELESRKLSVSDVEVSLTDERSAVGSVTEDPIGGKSTDQKHITPPTVPVSPNVLEEVKFTSRTDALIKEVGLRSSTPGSDDSEMLSSHIEAVSERLSKIETPAQSDEDDDQPSMTSQLARSRKSSLCEGELRQPEIDPMGASFPQELPHRTIPEPCHLFELTQAKFTSSSIHEPHRALPSDTMSASFMGDLPGDPTETWGEPLGLQTPAGDGDGFHGEMNLMTASFYGELPGETDDPIRNWGKPLGLPSPAPPSDNKGTPKKERRVPSSVSTKNKLNDEVKKRAESPSKYSRNNKKTTSTTPVYVDLTYVPHHGNTYYACVEFFKRVRARYYVFSGIEPSKEVYDALLEGKQTWEDKELEVTIIPTYDTDILGYWVAENEEILTKLKIDLSPSASRCTINLQDHETSCSAYRLEF